MDTTSHEITELLQKVKSGDKEAENRLFEIVMPELRRIAHRLLSGERPNHTLQGTELVNRMYLRLAGTNLSLQDRRHFFAIASRAMRRELIDIGRARPKVEFFSVDWLPDQVVSSNSQQDLAITIDELLTEMEESMPLECSIVELKFFLGMTNEETAEILGISVRTVQSHWQDARIWLFQRAEAQNWKPSSSANRPTTT